MNNGDELHDDDGQAALDGGRSESLLNSVFDRAPIGLSILGPDGRFRRVNAAITAILGRPAPEIVGRHVLDFTHPDDHAGSTEALASLVRASSSISVDKRYVRPDGEVVWANSSLSLLRPSAGGEASILVVTVDLTARRVAEEAVRRSERTMRIAIEGGELATWEWDVSRDVTLWNERHFRLVGMPPTPDLRVRASDFFAHVHPADRERVRRGLETACADRVAYQDEFRVIRADDGETRWMIGYGSLVEETADGRPLFMSGVMFDITDRRTIEDELRKSEEHLSLILESARDYAIISFDLDGRITRWNRGAEEIFGYPEAEAVGRPAHIIFTPEDIAAGVPEKELATTLATGRAEDERIHIRRDGTRFFASGMMQILRDEMPRGFLKICRDETAKLVAEQRAREQDILRRYVDGQEEERRRIARDIHDHLGQQLTAFRLKLDALRRESAGIERLAQLVDDAQKTAAELDRTVDFIAWELHPASLDDLGLRAALHNYVAEWSRLGGVQTEFVATGLGAARLARVIETNLYRIAQEALNNVLKHARATNVTVLLERNDDRLTLIVEDDGVGFDQLEVARRRAGLGLVGMAERARICGGQLEIESRTGNGTTVFARVPAGPMAEPDADGK